MRTAEQTKANAVNWLLIAWAGTQIIIGGSVLPENWGFVAMACGLLLLPAGVFGLARGRWIEPLIAGQLLLGFGVIVAAVVTQNLAVGLTGAMLLVITASVVILHGQFARLAIASATTEPRRDQSSNATSARMEHLLRQIHEATMLSDAAKRVLFRQRDIAAVRHAIQDEIAGGTFDVAAQLCDDLEMILDQGPMAEQLRAAIKSAQRQTHDARLQSDLLAFEQLIQSRNWAEAKKQADVLHERYGDLIIDTNLQDRIVHARQKQKTDLQQQFLHAASHNDIERAMQLLRVLDQYLSREEAQQLGEVAQNVVTQHRERLGREFQQAVNEHAWHDAARLGHSIINEFPNTKMANEVRSMIDLIRARATESAIAQADRPR